MCILTTIISLKPLEENDRAQFILDSQEAFMHGAAGECRVRDVYYESDGIGVSRQTIEASINAADAEAYRIFIGDIRLGGVVIKLDEHERGYVDMLFVSPRAHDCGIGSAAWEAIERLHPQIRVWETVVPYCEKKNIRFYVNRCGFHIVELLNSRFPNPYYDSKGRPEADCEYDDVFRLEKAMPRMGKPGES